MPWDVNKDNTKDKGKSVATTSKGKVPSHQEVTKCTKIQSIVDLSNILAKKVDKICFGVERVHELYDE